MNDLIQITRSTINGSEVNSVNARKIHEFLEVKTPLSQWIDRIIKRYSFFDGEDFITNLLESSGGRRETEFIVTMDMAKEMCMVDNSSKGRDARRYFIHVEKQSTQVSIPQNPMEALQIFFDVSKEQDSRIKVLEDTKRLEAWQEASLQHTKNLKVYKLAGNNSHDKKYVSGLHRKVWSLFKKHFFLPRYNELPSVKYQDGVEFINSLTISDMV